MTPTISKLTADEVNDLFVIYASQAGLARAKERMKQRLKTIPGASRDIAMICAVLDKLTDAILETIPPVKREQLNRNLRNMRHEIYFVPPVTPKKDQMVVFTADLDALVDAAMDSRCLMCDDNCNKCALGKALDHVMLHTRERHESWAFARLDGRDAE